MFDCRTTSLRHEMWVFWIIAQMHVISAIDNSFQILNNLQAPLDLTFKRYFLVNYF
jgi:hypothetical protein